MTLPAPPRIWTLTDDRAGNFNQAQALALAMGMIDRHISVQFPPPWRWLAPRGVVGALHHLHLPDDALWPDIAIGCGRQAALALRALKRQRQVFTVQILDPRIDPRAFDVVVTPTHDQLSGENVFTTTGALNAIDAIWLRDARTDFAELAALPRPRVGLLIGGPHAEAPLAESALVSLFEKLALHTKSEGGSLMICASRRTPIAWRPLLRASALALGARVWMDADDGSNPYRGFLAYADRLVVTADSVNMLSEACAVGVPVISFAAGRLRGKLLRFDRALRHAEQLCALDDPKPPTSPLRETTLLAERILQRWRARFANDL